MKKQETQPGTKAALAEDPLAILEVFDCLEVGPVKLEAKRLIAPYRLEWDGKEEQTELIYTYEENVFDSSEPEARNLASMIAAQAALNYGLFCRSIVFHGIFDDIDLELDEVHVVQMVWQPDRYSKNESVKWRGVFEWQCGCVTWDGNLVAARKVVRELRVHRGQILTATAWDGCLKCGQNKTVMFEAHADGSVGVEDERL